MPKRVFHFKKNTLSNLCVECREPTEAKESSNGQKDNKEKQEKIENQNATEAQPPHKQKSEIDDIQPGQH